MTVLTHKKGSVRLNTAAVTIAIVSPIYLAVLFLGKSLYFLIALQRLPHLSTALH